MTAIFVWVISCYLLAMLAVHLLGRRWGKRALTIEHYILIGNDEEQGLEWAVRRLRWRSFWTGVPVRMTVIDEDMASRSGWLASKLLREEDQIVCVAKTGEWRVLRCKNDGMRGDSLAMRRVAENEQDGRYYNGSYSRPLGERLQEGPLLFGEKPQDTDGYLDWLQAHGVTDPAERTVLIDLRKA